MKPFRKYKKLSYFITYTLLFLVMEVLVLLPFIIQHKSLIWELDGMEQHFTALVYIGRWGRGILKELFQNFNLQIPLWDFCIGYGSDIITTLHYYVLGDPLNLLSIFVPSRYTEYLYNALILLRMYLAGICFSQYCFYMKKGRASTLAGTFSYLFCGYMLFAAVRHPFFINPMIYLPLLLIGAERIFRGKSPVFFIGAVFLSAVSNFYFFYMLAFAVCFYVGVRFFTLPHKHLPKELILTVFRFAGYALTGVCMSAFILLPVLMQFFGTNRTDTVQSCPLLYDPDYYLHCLMSFITSNRIGEWTCLGFTLPALIALVLLFFKRKKYLYLKIPFLIMTGMLCFPIFGKILNGFSYVSNRWSFIYAANVSYILVCIWPDMTAAFRRLKIQLPARIGRMPGNRTECCFRCPASVFLFAVLLLHIVLNSCTIYSAVGQDYAADFIRSGTALETVMASPAATVSDSAPSDDTFFRLETNEAEAANTATLLGMNGTQYYWSLENPNVSDYLMEMALNRFRMFKYSGLDCRTFLNAPACIRYFAGQNPDRIPYGYEATSPVYFDQTHACSVYENKYALPLGYTYTSVIPDSTYQSLTPVQRQEALLQGVVLEDSAKDKTAEQLPKTSLSFTSKPIAHTVLCGEGITMENDASFHVTKANASVSLQFSGEENCETYLALKIADIQDESAKYDEFALKISSDFSENKLHYMASTHKYYTGQHDFLINLGYHAPALSCITITFPTEGTYRFQEIDVICQPMKSFCGQIAALKENTLEDIKIGTNTVKGSIQLSKDKILCLSIPYSKGWQAYVDGIKKPLLKANTMYMALALTAGKHTVTLYYKTPGLNTGILVSCMGSLLLIGILLRQRKAIL